MTCPRRFLIISNPVSGRRRADRIAQAVDAYLRQGGFQSETRTTSGRGDAQRIATEAIHAAADGERLCVVGAGGDGTVQELANAVALHGAGKAVLAAIPAGRCNDFARAVGTVGTPEQIARILAAGVSRPIDLGRIGTRYYCTVAAVGFDAAVSRFVNDMKMPLRGSKAYVYGTLRTLGRYQTPNLRLTGAFGQYDGPVFLAACANTPWYGGSMHIAPHANAFDGRLDICLVTAISRLRVLRMIPRVLTGRHTELSEVRMLRTPELRVDFADSPADIEVWADGEPITHLPVTIECVPSAIEVIVPAWAKPDR